MGKIANRVAMVFPWHLKPWNGHLGEPLLSLFCGLHTAWTGPSLTNATSPSSRPEKVFPRELSSQGFFLAKCGWTFTANAYRNLHFVREKILQEIRFPKFLLKFGWTFLVWILTETFILCVRGPQIVQKILGKSSDDRETNNEGSESHPPPEALGRPAGGERRISPTELCLRADFWEGGEDSNFKSLFSFQSPAVQWMARTSSLNCLSCRNPYQMPDSLSCLPPFHWKTLFFTEKCFVASPSKIGSDLILGQGKVRTILFVIILWFSQN